MNKGSYQELLKQFFIDFFDKDNNNSITILQNNKLFRASHMHTTDSESKEKVSRIALHRAKQWLSDIRTGKRVPVLTLDDLEIAQIISQYPVDALVRGDEYWNDHIDYLNKPFYSFIDEQNSNPYHSQSADGFYYPITYHPKTCTMLAAVQLLTKCKPKKSLDATIELDFSFSPVQYIVISLSDIITSIRSLYTDTESMYNGYKPRLFSKLNDAIREYDSKCVSENNSNKNGLKCALREFLIFSKILFKEKGAFVKIMKYQKLFYGFHSDLMNDKDKKDSSMGREKLSLDQQTNLIKLSCE